jgi:hypothetical protein
MKNKQFLFVAFMAIAVAAFLTACNKSSSAEASAAGKQQFSLYLTDGPGYFDHVYIDIQSVKVLVDTSADTRRHDGEDWDRRGANDQKKDSSFVWEDLNIKAGVYDILSLRNGTDTLLANSGITKGAIRLIKIQIGTNNSLVKDSVTYPLSIPADGQNYILVKLSGRGECEEYLPGKSRIWLDFDVQRSVAQINGKFYLRPVIKFFTVSSTASVSGKVTPKDALAVITVYNSTDTAYAITNRDGYFKIRGLKDGTYSVFINGSNGYIDTTINNVIVAAPKETSVGAITLRK